MWEHQRRHSRFAEAVLSSARICGAALEQRREKRDNSAMSENLLWLDKRKAPIRNGRDGYEFEGDCGLQSIVIETDKEITTGLSEELAQERLLSLRPRIEEAARRRHSNGDAFPESSRPDVTRFRIAITTSDLETATD